MPTVRRTLSSREQREHEAELRWFRKNAGYEFNVETTGRNTSDPVIEFGYGPNFYNTIFELQSTWLVVIVGARIVARRSMRLANAVALELPWADDIPFELWERHQSGQYRVGRAECFDGEQVINRQLESELSLPIGAPIEGFLIVRAFNVRLPAEYKPKMPISIGISVFDTFGNEYPREANLTVGAPLAPIEFVGPRPSTLFASSRNQGTTTNRGPCVHTGRNSIANTNVKGG